MVDIRKTGDPGEGLQAIARKTDARLTLLQARFDAVSARFDQLAAALAEQREYLERALTRLECEVLKRLPPPSHPPRDTG